MTEPIVMMIGCKEYEPFLHAAIKRLEGFRVIGVVGDPSLTIPTFDGTIVTLNVDDTYEALPKKVFEGFKWCYHNFPEVVGVLKTDDDIVFKDIAVLKKALSDKSNFWGFRTQSSPATPVGPLRIQHKFTDKSLRITVPKAQYCWGHGYFLSRKAISLVLESEDIFETYKFGLEDMLIGYALNKKGVYPKQISIAYKEVERNEALLSYTNDYNGIRSIKKPYSNDK
jgi:hypothetical protein